MGASVQSLIFRSATGPMLRRAPSAIMAGMFNQLPTYTSRPVDTTFIGRDAVVIGGSIAGLLAAHTLAAHYRRVTVLERDALPQQVALRPGTPQARHVHTLLPDAQTLLEQLVPGFVDDLVAGGAWRIDTDRDMTVFSGGSWHPPTRAAADRGVAVAFSRPYAETRLRSIVAELANVVLLTGIEVTGLATDAAQSAVVAVQLRRRGLMQDGSEELPADLVVDASGRGSQAPRWLTRLGLTPPQETSYPARVGYATRLYQRPARWEADWKILHVRPQPPTNTRGGLIVPVEGDRWLVTLIGADGDFPPTDVAGFEAFARELPTPRIHEALQHAEPLADPAGFQVNATRQRNYADLEHALSNFLVSGDAFLTLNPVYGFGMMAAALGARTLDDSLRALRNGQLDAHDLSHRFQLALATETARLQRIANGEEPGLWPVLQASNQSRTALPLTVG